MRRKQNLDDELAAVSDRFALPDYPPESTPTPTRHTITVPAHEEEKFWRLIREVAEAAKSAAANCPRLPGSLKRYPAAPVRAEEKKKTRAA